jgi:hypothetical protein
MCGWAKSFWEYINEELFAAERYMLILSMLHSTDRLSKNFSIIGQRFLKFVIFSRQVILSSHFLQCFSYSLFHSNFPAIKKGKLQDSAIKLKYDHPAWFSAL